MASRRKYRPKLPRIAALDEISYKGHRPGSKLNKLHAIFDRDGRDAAIEFGRKPVRKGGLGLSDNTILSQVRYFQYGLQE